MPYLLHVVKGKEKRVVEVFGLHGVVAKKALIGEYVVTYDPKSEELRYLDSISGYIRNISPIEDEEVGRFLGLSETVVPKSGMKTGSIVRILSGEYQDFRGIVRRLANGKAEVDVIVFGRMRPVSLNRDDVALDALPEGLKS
jgi:transcription antitermination factor NusG